MNVVKAMRHRTCWVTLGLVLTGMSLTVAAPTSAAVPVAGRVAPGAVEFEEIPDRAPAGAAVRVIRATGGRAITYVSRTPMLCEGAGRFLLLFEGGRCRVEVYADGRLIQRISMRSLFSGVNPDEDLLVDGVSLLFNGNASKVTKVAKAQMADFSRVAKRSRAVVVMGFAANDGGELNSGWSRYLSMRRAQKVADHLRGLGVNVANVSWHANLHPASKTRLRQNRRVYVAWIAP